MLTDNIDSWHLEPNQTRKSHDSNLIQSQVYGVMPLALAKTQNIRTTRRTAKGNAVSGPDLAPGTSHVIRSRASPITALRSGA